MPDPPHPMVAAIGEGLVAVRDASVAAARVVADGTARAVYPVKEAAVYSYDALTAPRKVPYQPGVPSFSQEGVYGNERK